MLSEVPNARNANRRLWTTVNGETLTNGEWKMTSTSKLPKHILSITRPKAQHGYSCVWCNRNIDKDNLYVRVVWEDDDANVHSDHICIDCWSAP
jgi:hypothetical protein